MNQQSVIFVTFVLYLGMMLGIGLFFYKKTVNLSDYVLGGRKLGKWVTSISAQASDMSGWLLMGLPGAAYFVGLSGAVWMALGLAIGTYLNWAIVAKKLRIATEKYGDCLTMSSYFENRFEDYGHILKVVASLFIIIFFLIYTASGFVAGGKLFSQIFNISYSQAVLIGAIVVVSYTFLGGFMAVCWTDLIQGIVMFFTLIILPVIVVSEVGGLGVVIQAMPENLLNSFDIEYLSPSQEVKNAFMAIIGVCSSLAWGLGYFGQPHILTRFMAIHDPEEIKRSRTIAMLWVVISLIAATFIGMLGHGAIQQALTESESENVFILLVMQYAPLLLSGVLLSAILAAIMSTADSQLLVTASAVSEDFYRGILRPKATEKELVWVGRITVLVVAIIAYIIALKPDSSVLKLVSWAWAGFGASFGPVVLISLFWKRMTKEGALSGMVIGGGITLLWPVLKGMFPGCWLFYVYEILPGFLFASLGIYVVSKYFKQEGIRLEKRRDEIGL